MRTGMVQEEPSVVTSCLFTLMFGVLRALGTRGTKQRGCGAAGAELGVWGGVGGQAQPSYLVSLMLCSCWRMM